MTTEALFEPNRWLVTLCHALNVTLIEIETLENAVSFVGGQHTATAAASTAASAFAAAAVLR